LGDIGQHAVQRADRAGDVARAAAALGRGVGALAGQPRRGDIHLVGQVLDAVLGLHDARRAEGVGLDDVGAGVEVASWIAAMTSGRVKDRRSVLPFWSCGWPRRRSPRKSASPSW